jgi:hypothetical protein
MMVEVKYSEVKEVMRSPEGNVTPTERCSAGLRVVEIASASFPLAQNNEPNHEILQRGQA